MADTTAHAPSIFECSADDDVTLELSIGAENGRSDDSPQLPIEISMEEMFTVGFDPRKVGLVTPKPWSLWTLDNDFEIGKPLGDGRFGHVYLARTKKERMIVALKVVFVKQVVADKMEKQINQETEIHMSLEHLNIINMYGTFLDKEKIVYVLEYAPGGDVFSALQNEPLARFSEKKAATYIYQVSEALQYLHSKNIIHRDIKPENLLLGYHGEIKMADFGWSVKTARSDGGGSGRRKTMCGTLDYLPPEMVNHQLYDKTVDLWTLGILCYEFLVGNPPFQADGRSRTLQNISSVNFIFPSWVSIWSRNFIRKILVNNPQSRLTLDGVQSHPFITLNKTTESNLLPIFDQFSHLKTPELENVYRSC